MRTYRVLAENEDGTYKVVGHIKASSAEQAIRLAATDHGDGRYVAVPISNWNESGAKREVRVVLTDVVADTDEDETEPEDDDEPQAPLGGLIDSEDDDTEDDD